MYADSAESIYFLNDNSTTPNTTNQIGRIHADANNMYFEFYKQFIFSYNALPNGVMSSYPLLLNSGGLTVGNNINMTADGTQSIYFLSGSNKIGRLFGTTTSMYLDFYNSVSFRYTSAPDDVTGMSTALTLGSSGATAPSFNTTSDYRIKENIINLKETDFNIDNLRPVYYDNKKTNKKDIGLIAHEVQKEFPFLVN
jgi:hypothetical protein